MRARAERRLGHGSGELGAGVPGLPVEELGLGGGEERFAQSVVQRISDRAHRPEDPGCPEPLAEHPAGVLPRLNRWSL